MDNDNLNNDLDNLFDGAVDDNFVDTKEGDHEKDEDSNKPLEHKVLQLGRKRKRKRKIIVKN